LKQIPPAMALAMASCLPAWAQTPSSDEPGMTRSLGGVTVTGSRPSSLPTQIPTTVEGMTREEIETRINATDSEDALKYLPSLLVRKRYIGDYNHAILSTRASGTGNSARSAAFGIDNANNARYWNFHPYPQRTWTAEVRFDL
jgi:iron complex outermembrane receptor protein